MWVTFDVRVPVNLWEELRALRVIYATEALRLSRGDVKEAARLLKVRRTTLNAWIAESPELFVWLERFRYAAREPLPNPQNFEAEGGGGDEDEEAEGIHTD